MKKLKILSLVILLSIAHACSHKSKNLRIESSTSNCCEMMPDISVKEINAQKNILSPEIFSFLIQAKATKACACIDDEDKKNQCYKKFD